MIKSRYIIGQGLESEETLMVIASKLSTISVLFLSLGIGFFSFYLFSDLAKGQKKKHLEELTSQLINFILFVWLGKIVLNFSIFLSDPLSILAYPSDSRSFYFGIVCIVIFLLYKSKRKNLDILPLLESFTHIFLVGSFVYEYFQLIVEDNIYAFGHLLLLAILFGIFFFLGDYTTSSVLLMVLAVLWSIGMIVLAMIQPFVTVFGYIIEPWFAGLFLIISIAGLIYKLKKKNS